MATRKASTSTKKTTAKSTTRPSTSRTKKTVTKVKTVIEKPTEKQPAPVAVKSALLGRRYGDRSFVDQLTDTRLLAALIAEFIGTFLLAAVVLHPQYGAAPFIMMFALMAIVLVFGQVSGGYVNPALTVGAWLTRRMSGIRAVAYIVAQVLGALLAFTLLSLFMQQQKPASADPSMLGMAPQNIELTKVAAIQGGKEWFMLGAELLGTLIFALGVAAATRSNSGRLAKALSVGGGLMLGLTIAGLAAAAVSGNVALNPAVAFSLQAIPFNNEWVWPAAVYLLGSTLGAAVGFLVYDLLAKAVREERLVK